MTVAERDAKIKKQAEADLQKLKGREHTVNASKGKKDKHQNGVAAHEKGLKNKAARRIDLSMPVPSKFDAVDAALSAVGSPEIDEDETVTLLEVPRFGKKLPRSALDRHYGIGGHFYVLRSPTGLSDEFQLNGTAMFARWNTVEPTFDAELRADAGTAAAQLTNLGLGAGPYSMDSQVENGPVEGIMFKSEVLSRFNAIAGLSSTRVGWEVVMYYVGHGQDGTGDWLVFNDEHGVKASILKAWGRGGEIWTNGVQSNASTWFTVVTLDDLLDAWCDNDGNKQRILTLICDCCCAGAWAEKLKKRESQLAGFSIGVYAATTSKGAAFGNQFMAYLTRATMTCRLQTPVQFALGSRSKIIGTETLADAAVVPGPGGTNTNETAVARPTSATNSAPVRSLVLPMLWLVGVLVTFVWLRRRW